MMKCIEVAREAGHISPDEARNLNEQVSRLLREGLAPRDAQAEMVEALSVQAREARRRALVQEERRQALTEQILSHKNARGENDPAEALTMIVEHHGHATFQDIEHLKRAIMAEAHGELEAALHDFRKGYILGDKRRSQPEVAMQIRDMLAFVMEGQSAKPKSAGGQADKAAQFAQVWLRVAENFRQRFNGAGGHIGKIDYGYMPQSHNPDAIANAGGDPAQARSYYVDYMMQRGVLNRERMVNPYTGRVLGDEDLRKSLEVVWERITTDGWIDKDATSAPLGRGALGNQHAEERFLHFADADAWLAYHENFGNGDAYDAMVGHMSKMARDIATMEILGPNPEAMRNYLKQLVTKQAAIAKPAAIVIGEETAKLKKLVAKAHKGDGNDEVVARISTIINDLSDLHRRMGVGKRRDVPIEAAVFNKVDELNRLKSELGQLPDADVAAREAKIIDDLARIEAQIGGLKEQGGGKRARRRNSAKIRELGKRADRLGAEMADIKRQGKTVSQRKPELHNDMIDIIERMKRDVDDVALAKSKTLEPVERVIEDLASRLRRLDLTNVERLTKAGDDIKIIETKQGKRSYRFKGQAFDFPAAFFTEIANDIRQRRIAGDPKLREELEQKLTKAIDKYGELLDGVGIGREHLLRAIDQTKQARPLFVTPDGFRSTKDPASTARKAISVFDNMWDILRGNHQAPVSANFANRMQAVRNVASANQLGAAVVSALGDTIFQRRVRKLTGMPHGTLRILSEVIGQFNTMSRREAVRSRLLLDSALHVQEAQARFVSGIDPRTKAGYMADRVIQISGLSGLTQAGKHSFGMALQADLADLAHLKWADLPDRWNITFEQHGLGADDWEILRRAEQYSPGEGSAGLLRPNEVAKGEGGRDLAERYLSMILRQTTKAVPEGTTRSKAAMIGGRKGTLSGEISANFWQYKTFSMAVVFLHLREMQREFQAGRIMDGVSQSASFLITGAIGGALILELKEIIMGRNTRLPTMLANGEVPGADYWMAGLMQGGGLGIYGDFIFNGVDRYGGLASMLIGPVGGSIDRIRTRAAKGIKEGGEANIGRYGVQTLREVVPGSSLWFARTALDRMVFSQLQKYVDPDADKFFRTMESRQKKKKGNEYWWRPGEFLPDSIPHVTTADPNAVSRNINTGSSREALFNTLKEVFGSDAKAVELMRRQDAINAGG